MNNSRKSAALAFAIGLALAAVTLVNGRALAHDFISILPVRPLAHLINGSQAVSAGSDGRLTFLLLGSDARGGGVERTDTIMVASVRGNSISVLSIPRDTARIPNPDGGTFSGRVNTILQSLAHGRSVNEALARFEVVIENLLQIEIDYYAMVKFDGFTALVEEIQPVPVDIARAISDDKFWDDPGKPSGVYFPQAANYDLYAWQPGANPPLCNGLWRSQSPIQPSAYCHRAMPFVRSRKGPGNSDFARARRQQDFVLAAVNRVIGRGSGALGPLVDKANGQAGMGELITDVPINVANAADLYQQLSGASAGLRVVFAPPTYSTHIPGTTAYELKLDAVRQVTRTYFGGSDSPPPPPATPTAPPAAPTSAPSGPPNNAPTFAATNAPPPASPGSGPTFTATPAGTFVAVPTAPGASVVPGAPVVPGDPGDPVVPGESLVPGGSVAPGAPVESGTPAEPEAPAGSPGPQISITPPTIVAPGASSAPAAPGGPTSSDVPDPGEPSGPPEAQSSLAPGATATPPAVAARVSPEADNDQPTLAPNELAAPPGRAFDAADVRLWVLVGVVLVGLACSWLIVRRLRTRT